MLNITNATKERPAWSSCGDLQERFGALYNIVMVSIWFMFLVLLYLNVKALLQYRKIQKKREIDLKVAVFGLNIYGCFTRIIWLLDPQPNSQPFGVTLWRQSAPGAVFSTLLIKTAQVGWLAGALLMILVWKQLVDAAQKMKQNKGMEKEKKFVKAACVVLTVVQLPLCILESLGLGLIWFLLANFIMAVYMISLLVAGLFYSFQLNKILAGMNSVSGKKTIKKIRFIIIGLVACAFTLLGGIALYTVAIDLCGNPGLGTSIKYFAFILMVHGTELVGTSIFYIAVAQSAKKKKRKGSVTGSTTASSVASTNN